MAVEIDQPFNSNPNAPPKTMASDSTPQSETVTFRGLALAGAIWSVVSAFPIAGLMALVFRFPVPFAGYLSGINAILPAMIAVGVYGVMLGGFIPIALIGALGGTLTAKFAKRHRQRWIARSISLATTTACLFVLAVLDWFIGSW